MTSSAADQRIQLAKLCSSKDWSKAIRVLDSLITASCVVQDLCNRAFCYSQLELHKHAIKDCDRALQLDPNIIQAYIIKGHALSSLGRKEDALSIWKQGYEHGILHSADLKQVLELVDLLKEANGGVSVSEQNYTLPSDGFSIPVNGYVLKECTGVSDRAKDNGKIQPTNMSNENVEVNQKLQMGQSLSANENFDNLSDKNNRSYQAETDLVARGKSDFSDSSESSTGSCSVNGDLSDLSGIFDHPCLAGVSDELMDEIKHKFCTAKLSKKKSINVDFRLAKGISHVNDGNYDSAISIFDKILQEEPEYSEALIGRGTAYAFQRELHAAIADFTKAIESDPSAGEAWKRRGQARAALGESAEAISDLTKALEFEPNSADVLHERGIVNYKFKDYNAAVEDLSACVEIESDNKSAYTYLGLALSSVGEYEKAEEAHMKAIQIDRLFLEAWTHLAQFYQDLADSEKALQCLHEILQIDGRFAKAYHLRGLILHGIGEHRNAIKELSTGLSIETSNIECLYLRASCYHAIGEFKEAVKDYDASLDVELDSVDKFVLQCLAFYQKEIALYTASKLNTEFSWFDPDGDIDPLFKEYWCKKLHPKNVCEKVYRQPPLRDSLRKGKLKKQDFSLTKQKAALLQGADSIGSKIQYHCPGFLRNKRQYRMAGLAAIEIAQKVVKVWRSLQNEWKRSIKGTSKNGKKTRRERLNPGSYNRGGAGCSTSSFLETSTTYSEPEHRSYGRPTMVWNGVYSLAIKWRQISEPCDPVFWINKMGEDFNSGLRSHTPLILGQARNVHNFQRALNVAKDVIKDNKFVRGKDKLIYLHEKAKIQEIVSAESYLDLYRIVGEDFWLTTWCNSTAFEGKRLEGTRINISKSGQNGYDFAISTPSTPSRWEEFDVEMTSAWEALCDAYCGENYGSTELNVLDNIKDAILRMTYYWYNFTPLSRGTGVVGLVVMLGLLMAANMEFTGSIPKGVQVDWEAILESDPNSFVSSVKSWLYPSIKVNTSWKGYPDVSSTFETTGLVVAALSSYFD